LVSAVIANSHVVESSLRLMVAEQVPLRVIYNGIRLNDVRSSEAKDMWELFQLSHVPVVLAVGRVSREKGWQDLVQASARLPLPHSVVAVGPTPDEGYLLELKDLVRRLGVPTWIWAGARDDIWSLMKSASVLAVPSRREAFGRVVVEAWACGLPVVAARSGGLSEIVRSGVDGILVPPEKPDEMAEALEHVLVHRETAEKLSAAGKRRAEEFSLSRHLEKVSELYEEVLSR
jgi:glycosyltransferase involved in cell wall biosynthesis